MTEDEVIRAHTSFNDALKKQHYHELEELYADDYMLVRPDGSVLSKSEVLEDLKRGGLAFHDIELSNVKVRIHSDAALLTGDSRTVTSRKGKEATAHIRLLAAYARIDGKLRLVHFQSIGLL